jgi:hypothetical protein
VHQPLHATSRFSADLPGGDRGGNLVTLCNKPCRDELHGFWDDVLGKSTSAIAAIRAAKKLPQGAADESSDQDVRAWVEESFQIAQKAVYTSPVGGGRGPYPLTETYKQAAKTVAQERVALAGVRPQRFAPIGCDAFVRRVASSREKGAEERGRGLMR